MVVISPKEVNSLFDFKDGKFTSAFKGKSARDVFVDASVGALKNKLKETLHLNYGENNLRNSAIDFMGAGGKILLNK